YSGPDVAHSRAVDGWTASACDESALAHLLHVVGMPVVVLDGRAELGPRALGNRSILAPATHASMRRQLNLIKDRADYRPIAPICLESRASEVFDPGGSDRFMLFDHAVRPGWVSRVPAVQHLDGSARLQTIAPDTVGTRVGQILMHYERLSGIPVLCNTSANLSGHGFFPDVRTATRWGRTPYVWSAGILYTNATRPL
ncbi:MAG TPA: carbamoyltransferase C-terminal domain-containing protein, partial [Mycobacterium sp.]|nr:carbamoyltransferase C-terminal domain-containing protein [Mycobacterium sp.]